MAEEKIEGLEGLDDFGDDFSEQLDSFMENEGEDESDSELDSFFEDLSTIDDLEDYEEAEIEDDKKTTETGDTVTESSEETEETDTAVESEEKPEGQQGQQEQQKKKEAAFFDAFPIKSAIVSGTAGLLLGLITILALYYNAPTLEKPEQEIADVLSPKTPTKVVKVRKVKQKDSTSKPKKTVVKSKIKRFNYYVQVVSCISQECVNESRLQLKILGHESEVWTTNKKSKIAELITTKILSEEDATKIVKKINNINTMAGHAFRKSVKNGFQISLGLFPNLKTANMVRTHLNKQFKDQLFFKIQSTTQKTKYKIVQVGGIKSKPVALKLRDQLKDDIPDFQEAFVKTFEVR